MYNYIPYQALRLQQFILHQAPRLKFKPSYPAKRPSREPRLTLCSNISQHHALQQHLSSHILDTVAQQHISDQALQHHNSDLALRQHIPDHALRQHIPQIRLSSTGSQKSLLQQSWTRLRHSCNSS